MSKAISQLPAKSDFAVDDLITMVAGGNFKMTAQDIFPALATLGLVSGGATFNLYGNSLAWAGEAGLQMIFNDQSGTNLQILGDGSGSWLLQSDLGSYLSLLNDGSAILRGQAGQSFDLGGLGDTTWAGIAGEHIRFDGGGNIAISSGGGSVIVVNVDGSITVTGSSSEQFSTGNSNNPSWGDGLGNSYSFDGSSNANFTCGSSVYDVLGDGILRVNLPPIIPKLITHDNTVAVSFNLIGQEETIYDDSSTGIGSLTITLPSSTRTGQILRYVSKRLATTVTVNGTIVVGTPLTTLAANASVAWQAVDNLGNYIRIQ